MTKTDQVNPGESYDLLLMSLVKSTLVYFDIEKAYDTMWREGLLIKLNGMGIIGRMYTWIVDFLFDRTFQVRVGSDLSRKYELENGTTQVGAISPILVMLMIDDLFLDIGQMMVS
jgi:hypothetical protein